MAEFAPALFIFFLIILFPLIDLMGLAVGSATITLLARQAAVRAANASNYDEACDNVQTEAVSMTNSGFGKFAKLKPMGGAKGCGVDLYVKRTDITTNATDACGPNQECPAPIDSTKYIYEYSTSATFGVGPFVNLSSVPFIGNVPGIGQPAVMTMVYHMAVENPSGLVGAGAYPAGTFK
jgi:hypothetical protein